jgi:hypothetical protein
MLKQEYCMTEYLRMSGIYWGLTAIELIGNLERMNKQEVLDFIKVCQDDSGGISASTGHDPHLLYTLSAVQVRPCHALHMHLFTFRFCFFLFSKSGSVTCVCDYMMQGMILLKIQVLLECYTVSSGKKLLMLRTQCQSLTVSL